MSEKSENKILELSEEDKNRLAKFEVSLDAIDTKKTWQLLGSFWNFGTFRKGVSDLTGKKIITTFSENPSFPIYAHDEWKSDKWDSLSYGRDYDFSKPFFLQLAELQKLVPHPHQFGAMNTNCDWASDVWHSKNCYLSRTLLECEDVDYGFRLVGSKRSVDITYSFDLERCYDCLYCYKSYRLQHGIDSRDCVDSFFLYDCRNCSDCFMSWGLRNKQYCIKNVQHTKEEYKKIIASMDLGSRSARRKLKEEFMEHIKKDAFHRENHNVQTKNSSGNYLSHDNNCRECYFVEESENCLATARCLGCKDLICSFGPLKSEEGYLIAMGGYNYGSMATLFCTNCRYSYYLDACEECEYCFGCVGLEKKKYCILNKQYTKEEYESLVEKIKSAMKTDGSWGEFFPKNMAYSEYNNSFGSFYYPLTDEEIVSLGFRYDKKENAVYDGIDPETLPDNIKDVTDEISKIQLICPVTGKKFGIAPQELAFYKSENIPLPVHYFDYRTKERFKPFSSLSSFAGNCAICKKSITHFYPP